MRGIHSYRRSTIEGATNEELLILFIERVITLEEEADGAMERGDRRAWQDAIHKARGIFVELRTFLDHSLAPEITANIDRTYAWCIHHLTASAKDGDRTLLAEVRRVTGLLHTTWVDAVRLARKEQAVTGAGKSGSAA
jgi:flagellar biosynthetic protein FliS